MEHTKGPWEAKLPIHPSNYEQSLDVAIIAGGQIIAECYGQTDIDFVSPSKANAHLISAAPDMFDALVSIRHGMKRTQNIVPNFLNQAIAKARGEK